MDDTSSYWKRSLKVLEDLFGEAYENASLYMTVAFIILLQMFVDHVADYVGQYYLIFDLMIRGVSFILTSCIFSFCELTDGGLTRI